ncbi:glycosyltransferase family 87 protein [Nitrospira sp. Nam80]
MKKIFVLERTPGKSDPSKRIQWAIRILASVLIVLSLQLAWKAYTQTGLFIPLASDYGLYLSQAMALQEGDPRRIYDRNAIDRHYKALLDSYGHDPSYQPSSPDLWGTHVPYPPIFAWAMQPFTRLPIVSSVAAWTVVNLVLILCICLRLARHCPGWDRMTMFLCLLASYPIVLTMAIGQLQIVMAWALMECMLALRTGNDWQAGLWLGLLLLKPQYGLLLGPILIWKQRWKAVLGVAVTGLVLLGGSVATVGLPTLLMYPQSFSVMAHFRGDDPYVMINWRSLVLDLKPEITDRSGALLTMTLGGMTVACILWIWRGVWRPGSYEFVQQVSLTVLATLFVSYHSHPYGAVLLAAPVCLLLADRRTSAISISVACVALFLPTAVLTIGYEGSVSNREFYQHLLWASRMLKLMLFLLFATLFVEWLLGTVRLGRSILILRSRTWRETQLSANARPARWANPRSFSRRSVSRRG